MVTKLDKAPPLQGDNVAYLESLYEDYLKDIHSVSPEWRHYFASMDSGHPTELHLSHTEVRNFLLRYVKNLEKTPYSPPASLLSDKTSLHQVQKQFCVDSLVRDYRRFGHLQAHLDPLGSQPNPIPELALEYHNLSQADRETIFRDNALFGLNRSSLNDIYQKLQDTYCRSIGFEYMHIRNPEEVHWLQKRIEASHEHFRSSVEDKKKTLRLLIAVEKMESFLARKYVGQKRFSLQGGDSLIPLLHTIIQSAGNMSVEEVVMGMAHRGRLNVLFNVLGLSADELCREFEGKVDYGMTSGDVKYHMGFSSNVETAGGLVHLALAFNPSHLGPINPVVMGSIRARQRRLNDQLHDKTLGIIMHGDAAFTGQGVIMESFNMAYTPAYNVGGMIHIVVNNQIGFTTNPTDGRSTHYCTDFAKAIESPIFHVNADDPEAVLFVGRLALKYRMVFKKDAVIDLVCYRRLGHNEADEPIATQPLMYQNIRQHPPLCNLYAKSLVQADICTQKYVDDTTQHYENIMNQGLTAVKRVPDPAMGERRKNHSLWLTYIGGHWDTPVDTRVPKKRLNELIKAIVGYPKDFKLQTQVKRLMENRAKMGKGLISMDWGFAETLAYASLLDEKYPVRLVGQDSRRGTFAHRHAVLHDQNSDSKYVPLCHLNNNQAEFQVYDSVLSEESALAFEYGYATADPNSLVIWEAQFGDFANGAQVIIDQFISSGWQKWKRLCGLVMLLPHGYEGMGPEHSSARLERYLQLTAQENIQVCVPSTPAQIFHLLRRQMLRPFRKPLVVMTPKSLLRYKLAVSSLDDLTDGAFSLVIPEVDDIPVSQVDRVVFCSGKVFYDLLNKRRESNLNNVAIMRIEQLYPFPYDALRNSLNQYPNAKLVIWCQEEPRNQGAWYSKKHCLEACLGKKQKIKYAGRDSSAAPAAGYPILHHKQQKALVVEALGL